MDGRMIAYLAAYDARMRLLRWRIKDCPQCGGECEYEPPHPREDDTGIPAWRGGWACGCGWVDENQGE